MSDLVKVFTGLSPIWIWKGKWVIRRPDQDDLHGHGLGYPRGYDEEQVGHLDAYLALAEWLKELGVTYIAGPILSGAQMAYTVSLASGGLIRARYLPKEGYCPSKHYTESSIRGPYAMIDDIVATGHGMMLDTAMDWAKGEPPVAIIADYWGGSRHGPLDRFADRLWTVAPVKEQP